MNVQGTFLSYAHRHRSILGAAGHVILISANHLLVMGRELFDIRTCSDLSITSSAR
jgi:hypothetical protein